MSDPLHQPSQQQHCRPRTPFTSVCAATLTSVAYGVRAPLQVSKLTKGETLMVNIGSTSAGGRVVVVKDEGKTARIQLTQPVCTKEDEKIALSRRVEGHFRYVKPPLRAHRPCRCAAWPGVV